jgi:hypothetical protein
MGDFYTIILIIHNNQINILLLKNLIFIINSNNINL